jgi:hypothetical protein
MLVKQFQDEPIVLPSVSRFAQCGPDSRLTEGGRSAGIASMLLGLGLRGGLTDSDRTLLDQLAPGRCITFLVHDQKYLHPADVALFPLDVIRAAVDQEGGAIFTHRYPANGENATAFKIHTAKLNPGRSPALILGFFGPEYELDHFVAESSFLNLVSEFRQMDRSLADVLGDVGREMAGSTPTVVVNRSSGRIVALNQPALELLLVGDMNPIDREFCALKDCLEKLASGVRLKMKNLSAGDVHLSLVSLERQEATNKARFAGTFLLNRMRETVSGFTAAASLMESIAVEKLDQGSVSLLRNLVAGCEELDGHLTRLGLLVRYDDLPAQSVNISNALRRVVDRRNAAGGPHLVVAVTRGTDDLELSAPIAAHQYLLEAVLEAHLSHEPGPGVTLITLESSPSEDAVRLLFDTDLALPTAVARVDSEWSAYAVKLAARMGMDFGQCFAAEGRKITTELRIKMVP